MLNVSIFVLSAIVGLRFLTSGMIRLIEHQQRAATDLAARSRLSRTRADPVH